MKKLAVVVAVAVTATLYGVSAQSGEAKKSTKKKTDVAAKASPTPELPDWATTMVEPKDLSGNVEKGLQYLVNQQLESGGWGQGGGWRTQTKGGRIQEGTKGYQETADVGNTAIATMALIRAGNTPTHGQYAVNVKKGLEFILANVEKSDADSLFVTDARGTQIQSKIGVYADTFLSLTTLSEMKGRMGSKKANERLDAGLAKVIGKIEKNQKEDGSYAGNAGWASVLSQSVGNKGINRAKQAGADVDDRTIERVQKNADNGYDSKAGKFRSGKMGGTGAGISLYESSSSLAGLNDWANTAAKDEEKAQTVLADPKASKKDKQKATKQIAQIAEGRKRRDDAAREMSRQVSNERFVSGFGSAGGEEYLSYMNISETLAAQGGKEWSEWDKKVTGSLNKVQNEDGSWAGHHCITGRTFVTSSALLTLMADRAPVPVAVAKKGE